MKMPIELEDQYVKEVLYNTSLENLPYEEWKPIEGFENYAISNYGRLKSLERQSTSLFGRERMMPEKVMKLIFVKRFNKYLQTSFYNVHCTLSSEGEKYRKSIARLVYYHFC
ncbi:NUMOD4 motif-containing protein [Chryseobacterium soldanellicola]|uniref:NUMOD4 motif-containing protein n=1 Tax=Chryseobacterium soldanellicola TaxID=311333 RepID=A0A1H1E0Z0_9FLAO|nr:NUMOD4 domain-containing protein [Chryseobacterium soldanellicola]SDQ82168.1 NUMOD4 motif-containing protein [Chryseobacterium soldanellicola]